MSRFHPLFFLIFLFACAPANSYQDGQPQDLPLETLSVETAGGVKTFKVQIAKTLRQKQTGLMFRTEMPAEEGMLFTYKYPEVVGFWMRNTYIPLVIIFVRADGTIANIAYNTIPMSLDNVSSDGHVTGVLEINGGLAEALGIEPGDKVLYDHFKTGEGE